MDDLTLARTAAAEAAAIITRWRGRIGGAEFKGDVDPVTVADQEAEAAITALIATHRPEDRLLAEEGGASGEASQRCWVIDPLDGTVNFSTAFRWRSRSPGDRRCRCCVVRDVFRDEEFIAVRGGGATKDGTPITVSGCRELRRALVSTGFAYDRQTRAAEYTRPVTAALEVVQGIRRNGSAAIDLAWVACGRFDAHWEFNLCQGRRLLRSPGGWLSWDPTALRITAASLRHSRSPRRCTKRRREPRT
jgi:myo-inositol-1(or 4)-monophosphatase